MSVGAMLSGPSKSSSNGDGLEEPSPPMVRARLINADLENESMTRSLKIMLHIFIHFMHDVILIRVKLNATNNKRILGFAFDPERKLTEQPTFNLMEGIRKQKLADRYSSIRLERTPPNHWLKSN